MNTSRVVPITGAAGGIGTALVDRFLSNHDTVVAADLDGDSLESRREGRPQGGELVAVAADVCSEEDDERVAQFVRERFSSASVYSGVAEQVAYVAAKAGLASPDAAFITGQIINVVGGSAKH